MGEAVLGAFLSVLLEKLAHRDVLSYFGRLKKVNQKKLEKWTTTLREIEEVLDHAEEKRLMQQQGVISWLDDLRDLAYDVEDILDEFSTEMLRLRIKELNGATTSKLNRPFSEVKFNFNMNSVIKELNDRLLEICQRKDQFGLHKIGTSSTKEWKIPPSSCQPSGSVIGREEDKRKIVEFLSKEEPSSTINFHVVAIVGMAGVGKTTLAGDVYNDDDATQQFYPKGWVSVSDDFDIVRLTKEILQYVTSQPCHLEPFGKAQEELRDILRDKKFLIVLDDVWVKHDYDLHDLWTRLQSPFRVGATGSKIVVTTRDGNVAKIMGASEVHSLECISEVHCLEIFEQHAFGNRTNSGRPPNFEILKTKIAGKCGGLPLAARTLGGILCYKNLDEWEDLLNNELWSLFADTNSHILPVLKLSYHYLPSKLKRCFAYCSVLPHAYEFEEKQLILLWMAEGLIPPQLGKTKQMEDYGHKYIRELFFRSLFQKSSKNNSKYVMHDLVTDMARWAAGEICFRLDDKVEDNCILRCSPKARHLSYIYGEYDGVDRFKPIFEVIQLRTFLPLSLSNSYKNYLTRKVTYELLPKLHYTRVLSLNGYRMTELPDSIGKLKHLRYLDLSHTTITSLPESTSNLCNLQTLLLEGCSKLKALPTNMRNLINLRHLNNSSVPLLISMPPELGRLTNLQSLSNFVVGKGNESRVREIGSLFHLQGTLQLSRLENVIGAEDARSANLNSKEKLEALLLEWSYSSFSTKIAADILDMLQPYRKLKKLTISGYAGLKFSTWIGNPSFSNMVFVRLVDCNHCQFLPPFGQLTCLKELHIKGMDAVESVGPEFYGEGSLTFPALETFTFESMKNWKEWFPCQQGKGIGVFSCLKMLSIRNCPKLEGKLPENLDSLAKLEIFKCQELVISLATYEQLHELSIQYCKGVVHMSAVGWTKVKELQSIAFANVLEFRIQSGEFVKGLSNVKELMITGCEELTSSFQNENRLLQHLISLRRLEIENNLSLVEELGKEAEELLQSQMLACKLEYLKLKNCRSLLKVPEGLHHLTFLQAFPDIGVPQYSLKVMDIRDCQSLIHVARYQIPPSLRRLEIWNCPNLKSLIEMEEDVCVLSSSCYCLDYLLIRNCSSLMSFSLKSQFLRALKHFQIWGCTQLESIADKFHDSSCLEEISIRSCSNLKSLPESLFGASVTGGLALSRATSESNLRSISVRNCEKLQMRFDMHNLNSLQELRLDYFEGLTSFEAGKGFPPNLISLSIYRIKSSKALLESRGFLRLTSLRHLILEGEGDPDLVSFPHVDKEKKENEMLLPKSLIRLHISGFPNLKKLSNGFQFLTSLERLELWNCQMLESLPEEGLPHSLTQLQMSGCPLLAKRCKTSGKGRYWPKVAHIPWLKIDSNVM